MSNIVSIIRNDSDTQVEINGHEVCNVVMVTTADVIGTPGRKRVTLTFDCEQLNIVGINAVRDTYFDKRDNRNQPSTRWQRFKRWWRACVCAFERWQNS